MGLVLNGTILVLVLTKNYYSSSVPSINIFD